MTAVPEQAPAFTVWVTGLPASGKRALAEAIAARLRAQGQAVEVIDSGRLRQTPFGATLGFSRGDRETNLRRHAMAAAMLTRNGVTAVVSAVSPYRETREAIRAGLGHFLGVWVSTPADVCERWDRSGNWQKARAGQLLGFTGVDAPYENPLHADIVTNLAEESVDDAAERIVAMLAEMGGAVSSESTPCALDARLDLLGESR